MADIAPAAPPPLFAMTRTDALKDFAHLKLASRHAGRVDVSSWKATRPGCDFSRRSMAWSCDQEHPEGASGRHWSWVAYDPGPPKFDVNKQPIYPAPPPDWTPPAGCDYVAAWRACRAAQGARDPKKGAPLGFHALVMVSPDWLSEAAGDAAEIGRRRDLLVDEACAWARDTFGEGAVAAWRYDQDERGSAVVDLILVPVANLSLGGKPKRPTVSTNRALEILALAEGLKSYRGYAAMQTSWARWAQERLDARMERGTPKIETGRENLPADQVREDYERLRQEAEAAAAEADADRERREEAAAHVRAGTHPALVKAGAERREAEETRDQAQIELGRAETARDAVQAERAALQPRLRESRRQAWALQVEIPELRGVRDGLLQEVETARTARDGALVEQAEADGSTSAETARAELVGLEPALAAVRQARTDLPVLEREAETLRAEIPTLRLDRDETRADLAKARQEREKARTALSGVQAGFLEAQRAQAEAEATTRGLLAYTQRLVRWLGHLLPAVLDQVGELPPDVPPALESVLSEFVARPVEDEPPSSGPDGP